MKTGPTNVFLIDNSHICHQALLNSKSRMGVADNTYFLNTSYGYESSLLFYGDIKLSTRVKLYLWISPANWDIILCPE